MYKNLIEKKEKKKKKKWEKYNNVTLKAHGVAYITSESYFYCLLN